MNKNIWKRNADRTDFDKKLWDIFHRFGYVFGQTLAIFLAISLIRFILTLVF